MWWWLTACAPVGRPACEGVAEGPPETVTIDLAAPLEPFAPIAGLLHGSTSAEPLADPSLAEALRPPTWRTSVLSEPETYADLSPSITWVIPDDLDATLVGPAWLDLDATRAAVRELVGQHTTGGGSRVDVWDLGSEPNWTFDGTRAQWNETALAMLDAIRETDPGARVVGPSVGPAPGDDDFDVDGVLDFVDLLAASGRRVDALSWHEFFDPAEVATHAERVRGHALATLGHVPELHVDEFGGPDTAQVPGWSVAWLAALHAARVDQANRACWDVDGWNGCFEGLSGLLTRDGLAPQSPWWVWRAYAELGGDRLAVTTNGSAAALATRDGDHVRVLVGRADGRTCRGPTAAVRVDLEGLDGADEVTLSLETIAEGIAGDPSPAPPTRTLLVPVDGRGHASVALERAADGDAWLLELVAR